MREDHQLLALKVLFTEEQVALFQTKSEFTFSVKELTSIGIVEVNCDGKLHFIHCNLAEYYVADCLVNRLTEGNKILQQLHTFILKDIFLEYDYRVITVFVDGLLMLKQHGTQMDCLLHRAAIEGNVNIVQFLLHSARAGRHKDTLLVGQDTRKNFSPPLCLCFCSR
jgi:hypothetical protein